jgi:pyruvate/2-oxoglutarate dehydrogenase complex dihydrolipoamide acyltransferase (E2) component
VNEIVIPKLGLTVDEVVLLEWYVEPGHQVAVDEPVCEVESDKVIQEIVSTVAGTITELVAEEGATLEIGAVIARVAP